MAEILWHDFLSFTGVSREPVIECAAD